MTMRGIPGLAILRMSVDESAANTLTEAEVNTPVEPASRTAMRLWRCEFEHTAATPNAFPAADAFGAHSFTGSISTRQDLTAIPRLINNGAIALCRNTILVGSAPADAGVAISQERTGYSWSWEPNGLLIATRNLSIYVQGTALASALRLNASLYYTLETLEPAEFFSLISVTEEV